MGESRPGYGVIVMALVYMCYLSINYAQYQFSPLANEVMDAFGLTTAQFASIFSAPMLPACLLSLLAGLLADRFGIRRVMTVGFGISAAGLVLRVFATEYVGLMLAMVLQGFGMGVLYSNASKIIGSWVPPERLSVVAGVVLSAASLGMFLGNGTTALLPSMRFAYILSAAIAVFTALALVALLRDSPQTRLRLEQDEPSFGQCLRRAWRSRSIRLAALCMMCLMGATTIMGSFIPAALQELRGMDAETAGAAASMICLGNLPGSILGPWLCVRLGRFRLCQITAGIVFAAGMAFAWMLPQGWPMLAALFGTGFALGSMFTIYMSLPALLPEIGPAYAGTGGGMISTLQMLGAVTIAPYVIVPLSHDDYALMLLLTGGVVVVSCLLALFFPRIDFGGAAEKGI